MATKYATRNGKMVETVVKKKRKFWWAEDDSTNFKMKEVNIRDYEIEMGSLAEALNTHIRAAGRTKRHFDPDIPEHKMIPNKETAYGDLLLTDFTTRLKEALEMIKLLNRINK